MPRRVRPLTDRYWAKVVFGPECWGWSGGTTVWGYGVVGAGRKGSGMLLAHRVSYQLEYGPIPNGAFVRHVCDNPPCTNPAHLVLGTPADNTADAIARGRFVHLTPTARARGRKGSIRARSGL